MKIPRLSLKAKTFSPDIWNRFLSRYGNHRAERLVYSLARPSKRFAIRTTTTKISREELSEIFNEEGWKVSNHPYLDEMLTIETKGPNIVPYLSSTPRMIIDKIAAESVLVGSDLFGVGIRRMPKFDIGDQISLLSPKEQIVAIGVSRIDSKTPKSKGIAVFNKKSFYNVPSIRNMGLLESGLAQSQSIPASYVSHLLEPKEGDVIVDLCAAPGGKSTSASLLSNNKAKIIAFDRSKKRLRKMEDIVRNQELSNIQMIKADSIQYIKEHTVKADKVIVDPSCSAIGVRPKIFDDTTNSDVLNSANYQKSFLWAASKIVRKGGIITYSTCTTEPEENEKVITYAIESLGLKLTEPNLLLGTTGEETNDGLELEFMRRFYPDTFDTPGFFVAKLTKK